MMGNLARMRYEIEVRDATGLRLSRAPDYVSWSPAAALANGQSQIISLPATTFTALVVPTGAVMLALILKQAVSLTIKGVTGDVGWPLVPSTNPLGIDFFTPLGATPSIGVYNGSVSAQTIEAIWG